MKLEPLSIIASILAVLAIIISFIDEVVGSIMLIVAAIVASFSYRRFKQDTSYTTKWPLYLATVIVFGIIIVRIVVILLFLLFR